MKLNMKSNMKLKFSKLKTIRNIFNYSVDQKVM